MPEKDPEFRETGLVAAYAFWTVLSIVVILVVAAFIHWSSMSEQEFIRLFFVIALIAVGFTITLNR